MNEASRLVEGSELTNVINSSIEPVAFNSQFPDERFQLLLLFLIIVNFPVQIKKCLFKQNLYLLIHRFSNEGICGEELLVIDPHDFVSLIGGANAPIEIPENQIVFALVQFVIGLKASFSQIIGAFKNIKDFDFKSDFAAPVMI